MRYLMLGCALAAVPAAALAQASGWGAFENGVGVAAPDGSQLLLKCDKPGKGEVYATVFTPKKLVPPSNTFQMRPVKLRFDNGPVKDDRWRFYPQTAVAVNKTSEQALTRFLTDLAGASKVRVSMDPGMRENPVDANFDVAGAKEAIAQVYTMCKDENPVK